MIFKNRIKKIDESQKQKSVVEAAFNRLVNTIKYSTYPHETIPLSQIERTFFYSMLQQFFDSGLDPFDVRITRMSSMGFNVDTHNCYVGKINLYKEPNKYAVKKEGRKRATRVFTNIKDANNYISAHNGYCIETRNGENRYSMQYLNNLYEPKEIFGKELEEYISAIQKWIKYIKYCQKF